MQSTFCSNCGQPLPAGAAFCGNCGARQNSANQNVPPAPPPSAAEAATIRAGSPPASDYAPTQLQPPPPPPAPGGAPPYSPYAGPIGPGGAGPAGSGPGSMYPSPAPPAPMVPPPAPGYAPGPPPVVTPGGGVAPWAQPPKKKRTGLKVALGCLIILLLVVAVLGGGGYLLVKALSNGGKTGQHSSSTPGVGTTPGTSSTPGTGPNGTQTLNNINRQAIYAGVTTTIVSAIQTQKVSDDFQNVDPAHDDILKIAVKIDFPGQRHGGFYFDRKIMVPNGNPIDRGLGHGNPKDELPTILGDPVTLTGSFYFEVPKTTRITDWIVVIGEANEVLVNIPLAGSYDPGIYQEMPHAMGLNQPIKYSNGNITGVITKIITVTWNPCGCEAPKGMRFLRLYFHVTNNTALPVNVGDGIPPQYVLIYPNGDRKQADTQYNNAINVTVQGAESKDVGFDSWVIASAPAPYTILFLNPDGSKAGQIDLGTV